MQSINFMELKYTVPVTSDDRRFSNARDNINSNKLSPISQIFRQYVVYMYVYKKHHYDTLCCNRHHKFKNYIF